MEYEQNLKVINSGEAGEYVRVIVYKYWLDEDGKKDIELDPKYILLGAGEEKGWIKSEESRERSIYYYSSELSSNGKTSSFLTGFSIDSEVKTLYKEGSNELLYDGKQFYVDIQIQAVQSSNYQKAAMSAWGVDLDKVLKGE